jgi:hypothetical protein
MTRDQIIEARQALVTQLPVTDGLEMSRHFRRRGKRQEQQIALIRKLWQEPVVEYEDSDHRIVTQQHGGTIAADSAPGEFTEFTIRLPRRGAG